MPALISLTVQPNPPANATRAAADDPERLVSDPGVQAAAKQLASGGLLGLPTETVYGLAADAGQPTCPRPGTAVWITMRWRCPPSPVR